MAALPGELGLEVVRHYNSRYAIDDMPPGLFGRGWQLSYETLLYVRPEALYVVQADGTRVTFNRDPNNPALCATRDPARGRMRVERSAGGAETGYVWEWTHGPGAGRRLSFDKAGRLVRIESASGARVKLEYGSRGLLRSVTDPQGRSLRLSYGEGSRFQGVTGIDSPVGRYRYVYGDETGGASLLPETGLAKYVEGGGPQPRAPSASERAQGMLRVGNLSLVAWPDGGGRSYRYGSAEGASLLTEVWQRGFDGSERRVSSYGYGAGGEAVSSAPEGTEGVRVVSRASAEPERGARAGAQGHAVVESARGRTSHVLAIVGGENRLLESRGAGCLGCGPSNMRYAYSAGGRLVEAVRLDARGRAVSGVRRTLDAHGRVLRVERLSYGSDGTSAARLLARYEYGASQLGEATFDRPVAVLRPSVAPGRERRVVIAYNARGQVVRATESGWRPEFDASRSDAPAGWSAIERAFEWRWSEVNGRSVLTEYDGPLANGPSGSPVDSDVTRYEWDAQGHYVERVERSGGFVDRIKRDAAGRVASVMFDDGFRQLGYLSAYTARGALARRERTARLRGDAGSALSESQFYETDIFGRLVAASADGVTHRLSYDTRGRLSSYAAPGGERAEWRYDGHERPFALAVFDGDGALSWARVAARDEFGRELALLSPGSVDAFIPVSPPGSVASPEEPGALSGRVGSARVWRDDFGRVAARFAQDDGLTMVRYEPDAGGGEVQTHIYAGLPGSGAAPRWERLLFDGSGRLRRRERPGCADRLSYEGRLLLRLESCAGDVQTFARDSFGRITERAREIDGLRFSEEYRYGPGGRIAWRRMAGDEEFYYEYDAAGRLSRVLRPRSWAAWLGERSAGRSLLERLPRGLWLSAVEEELRWRPFGSQPSGGRHGNGAVWRDEYDAAGRLSGHILETDAGVLSRTRTRWHQGLPVEEERDGQWRTRLYDPAGRLLPGGLDPSSLHGTHPWRLPASWAGVPAPRMSSGGVAAPSRPTRFYGEDGLRTAAWGAGALAGERNAWGEQLSRGDLRLIWDADGHLEGIERGGRRIASYRYDARGLRVSKTLHGAQGAVRTYYLYGLDGLLAAEADGSGRVTREYLYHGTRPYALLEGRRLYAIHSDARGLPQQMLDEGQQVVWRGQWDDWGAPLGSPAPAKIALDLRLAGQYHDAESGLYYNTHRYYDPQQGAYISPDPLGELPGAHRLAYLNHNPLSGTDPLGLFRIPITTGLFSYLVIGENQVDSGHSDIVNAAFALYRGQVGETRFSRTIIDQIIKNNYHTDAITNAIPQTLSGQFNPLNHFDNPNPAGGMYAYENTNRLLYEDRSDWIQASVDQLNQNRGVYGAAVPEVIWVTRYPNISAKIGRLGQNMHVLADFYAHTNWVDGADRGGCFMLGDEMGYVPKGLAQTGLWDETSDYGRIFSGTVDGLGEVMLQDERPYTHAYWAKDSTKDVGGKKEADTSKLRPGQYFWEATIYALGNNGPKKTHKPPNIGSDSSENNGVFGEDYITDTGEPPTPGQRIYVRKLIANQYELAMSLAIEHTIKEIEKFYAQAAPLRVSNGLTLREALKMSDRELSERLIRYRDYPNKTVGHGGQ